MERLEQKAREAMQNAHVPYSKFKAGVALLTKSGKIYTGCNIENHGIMSICAERVAFCKAISEGEKEFEQIYVVADEEGTTPCGYCRQFMSEFVDKDFKITLSGGKQYTIEELLPHSFKLEEE